MATHIGVMHLDLSDDEAAALIKELHNPDILQTPEAVMAIGLACGPPAQQASL